MKANINLLKKHLAKLQKMYEAEILNPRGNPGNLIRTSKIVNELHEYVKEELSTNGVKREYIHSEKKIKGYFKTKSQDILVQKDDIPLLSINVRSQLSSIQKNYDTLFERLVAESVNIHENYPQLPCGYMYLLPTLGYSSNEMKKHRVSRVEKFNWEKYLHSFYLLAGGNAPTGKSYEYEKICLLAVDFSKSPVIILNSTSDFLSRGLISSSFASKFNYSVLKVDYFIDTLLNTFKKRNKVSITSL